VLALDATQQIDLLRTGLAVIAGLWVLFLYRRRREGKAVVRTAISCRFGALPGGQSALFVRVHVANVSAVVLRDVEATVTMLAPSGSAVDQGVILTRIAEENALLGATGEISMSSGAVSFIQGAPEDIEPNECIQSELVLPMPESVPSLVALRFLLLGTEGRLWPRTYQWTTFRFVDPLLVTDQYGPITSHATDTTEVHSQP
jgi:hypothetical protein